MSDGNTFFFSMLLPKKITHEHPCSGSGEDGVNLHRISLYSVLLWISDGSSTGNSTVFSVTAEQCKH